jgi:phage shock protein A
MAALFSAGARGASVQPGSAGASPLSADQAQAQISALKQSIRETREALAQARKERDLLLRERQALLDARPKPPAGGDLSANQQYEKTLKDWQARMDRSSERLAAKDKQIRRLEADLSALEAKLERVTQQLPPGRATRR